MFPNPISLIALKKFDGKNKSSFPVLYGEINTQHTMK